MSDLTERELDVLKAIASGISQRAIGRAYGYTYPSYVGEIANSIYTKLGAANGPNAVYLACQRGLLPLPAVNPAREEDDSGAVPAGAEVFHLGCNLGRRYADTHPRTDQPKEL